MRPYRWPHQGLLTDHSAVRSADHPGQPVNRSVGNPCHSPTVPLATPANSPTVLLTVPLATSTDPLTISLFVPPATLEDTPASIKKPPRSPSQCLPLRSGPFVHQKLGPLRAEVPPTSSSNFLIVEDDQRIQVTGVLLQSV